MLPDYIINQCNQWLEEAKSNNEIEPTAMTLSTVTTESQPSSRTVLLKQLDKQGFTFFTNFNSNKGKQLLANPKAALCFFWKTIHKQVLVEGTVVPVKLEEADAYWETRPRESQIGAWASLQSSTLENREQLLERFQQYEEQFAQKSVPRPEYWSGFTLKPTMIEFWEGKPSRLHHRIQYYLINNDWQKKLLFP